MNPSSKDSHLPSEEADASGRLGAELDFVEETQRRDERLQLLDVAVVHLRKESSMYWYILKHLWI